MREGGAAAVPCGLLLVLLVALCSCARQGTAFVLLGQQHQRLLQHGTGGALARAALGEARRQWRSSRAARARNGAVSLMAKRNAVEVTDETWRGEVLESDRPVLVFFSAAWCGPCRMVRPIVDEVLAEHGNLMRVVEVCTDENPDCVAECKVRSVPTLMLFSGGKAVVTVVGAIPKNALMHSLRKHVKVAGV